MQTIQKLDGKVLEAKQLELDVIRIRKMDNALAFEMAERLHRVLKNKYYQLLDYDTFESWLAQPEIDISGRTASRLIRIYKVYIIDKCEQLYLEVPENNRLEVIREKDPEYYDTLICAGVSKLDITARYIDKDNDYRLLNMASTLSRTDLESGLTNEEPIIKTWQDWLDSMREYARRITDNGNAPDLLKKLCTDFLLYTKRWIT